MDSKETSGLPCARSATQPRCTRRSGYQKKPSGDAGAWRSHGRGFRTVRRAGGGGATSGGDYAGDVRGPLAADGSEADTIEESIAAVRESRDLPGGRDVFFLADVAGEKVKPVQGADGSRVPLLRPGFKPNGAYTVSFVFLHSGTPFAKKGAGELALPKIDIPVGVVQWEVFLPKQYRQWPNSVAMRLPGEFADCRSGGYGVSLRSCVEPTTNRCSLMQAGPAARF